MSQFVGASLPTGIVEPCDQRHLAEQFRGEVEVAPNGDFTSPWWPGSGFFGEQGADVGIKDPNMKWWEWPDITRGANARYGIVGVSRDEYNSPLGGVTMLLFRVSDRLFVSETISDPAGNYILSTPYYPDAHFAVMMINGSPVRAGCTAFTLIGA